MMTEFNCGVCKQTFDKIDEWTDEDALKEYEENGFTDEDKVSVCDDCYNILMPIRPLLESIN